MASASVNVLSLVMLMNLTCETGFLIMRLLYWNETSLPSKPVILTPL